MLALTAVAASIVTIKWGWSGWVAVPAVVLLGGAAGFVSGALASWGKIQPFIATLAMFVFARGAAKYLTGGEKVSPFVTENGAFRDATPGLFKLVDSRILGGNLAVVTLIFAGVALVTWLLLARHRWGRQLYAVGGNEKAAALSGVPVNLVKTLAYVLSGAFRCGRRHLSGVAGTPGRPQHRQHL